MTNRLEDGHRWEDARPVWTGKGWSFVDSEGPRDDTAHTATTHSDEGQHEMTKRYTASDFANARYAQHPDGSLATNWGDRTGWSFVDNEGYRGVTDSQNLADNGWIPIPTKPTITETEVGNIAEEHSDDWLDGFITGYEKAGGEIIDDPKHTAGGTFLEETIRERVVRLVRESLSETVIESLPEKAADHLINHGLVKDN